MTTQMPPAGEGFAAPALAAEESRNVARKRQYLTPRRTLELRLEHAFRQLRRAGLVAEERATDAAPIRVTVRCTQCASYAEHRFRGDGRRVVSAARIKAVIHIKLRHREAFEANVSSWRSDATGGGQ